MELKRTIFHILFFLFCSASVSAQIEHPGTPWSQERQLKSSPVTLTLPALTQQARQQYVDQVPSRLKSMVFAIPYEVSLSCDTHGTWETLSDGSRIWRLTLISDGALSINLIFSTFHLPKGASMYLYTPDYEVIRGAFTQENETPAGVLATVPLPGDHLTVELNIPADAGDKPILILSKLCHDFRGFFEDAGLKHSGSCNVDINCPAGAEWQIEKRAVVKFIRGGTLLCSGALINNTANNGRPLLLTANHCIGIDWHAQQSVFYFRYEKPGCGSGTGSLQYSLSGSTLLATTSKVDFSLVELNTAPPKSYEPYFAGWDRRVVSYLDSVTTIHHPSGDVKKISKSFHRVVTGDFGGGYDTNTHWLISEWDLGTTEGGSSGSPLFNTDHRIVGDLTGGDASCSYNRNDYYQKLSVSWDRYPDSSNQLKYWLDPQHTGVLVLNGYDPYSGGRPLANFEFRPEVIQTGKWVYLTDKSTGAPTSWIWSIPGGTPESLSGPYPEAVLFEKSGLYQIILTVENTLGRDSIRQSVKVIDYPDGIISENRVVSNRVISLTDASSGEPLSVSWKISGADPEFYSGQGPLEVTLSTPREYSVSQIVEFNEITDTLIHYNRIKVIPDAIAFQPVTQTNLSPQDHTSYLATDNLAYYPGSNSQGISAYAEEFRNASDTSMMITGITLSLNKLPGWSKDYYLPVLLWNSTREMIYRDSILLSDYTEGSKVTYWLKIPVAFDTLNFAGFEVRPWSDGTFCSSMAVDRGDRGKNTSFVIRNDEWVPFTELIGLHTSLDVRLETAYLLDTYEKEITIVPNSNDGWFQVDLGHLVFDKAEVSVFNLNGQKIMSDQTRTGNLIELHIEAPVSGIYLVRIQIDNYSFGKKVLVIRN